ncbi:MAG: hypothetical protein JNK87_42550 [Bryobacterales bacterium]|nr:hypothetical protein [Bryobacterales bacterium]
MADEQTPNQTEKGAARNVDEVALEMMKFIALTTGYGKPSSSGPGFTGKSGKGGADEYADALLHLFARCRDVVKKG